MADAKIIAQMLGGRALLLARELFPHGKRESSEYRVGSVNGEAGRSLSIHIEGAKSGIWADFAAGQGGDALDLVVAALFGGDMRAALPWARHWLGMGSETTPRGAAPRAAPAPAPASAPDPDAERRRKAAVAIYLSGRAEIAGTPADAYLRGRAIDLRQLGRQPKALRFVPRLHNREAGCELPAMVAAVNGPDGGIIAVHRTWLEPDGRGGWTKARLRDAKMTLGSPAGGCIRLWRGAGGRPLREAAEGERVVLTEGIEDGLSVAMLEPELRVLCGLSLANMARVVLPPAITTVILAADNDAIGSPAARALRRVVARFQAEGREVRIARSRVGKDWNDQLRSEAA